MQCSTAFGNDRWRRAPLAEARAAVLAAVLLCLSPAPAAADDLEAARKFFEGKTMVYIVATAPSGGYDTYGRLVAKYLGKHLPVRTVVVKNVPGAGHIIGANELYAAEPNGLTLGTFNTGLVYVQLLQREGMRFDLTRMSYIGKAANEARGLVVSEKSGFESLDDVRKAGRPLLLGSSGVGSAAYNDVSLLAHALKLDIKHVFGFANAESQLSMMRGEIDGQFGSFSSNRRFVENGYGRFLLRVGDVEGDEGAIPDAAELVTTDDGRKIVALIRAQASLLRITAGPPGIPTERLAVLREAYMKSMRDPEMLAEAERLDLPIVAMDGAALDEAIDDALNQPPKVVRLLASVMDVEVETVKAAIELTGVEGGGKLVRFVAGDQTVDASISGSRTTVEIDGEAGDRSALAVGMKCDIEYRTDGEREAVSLDCRR